MLYDLPSNSGNFILVYMFFRSSHQKYYTKKVSLIISQNSQENKCVGVPFLLKFIKNKTPTQAFSCEFCKLSNNTYL